MHMMTLTGNGAHATPKKRPAAPSMPKVPPVAPVAPVGTAAAQAADPVLDVTTLRRLAYHAIGLGRLDDARVVLARAMELHPGDAEFIGDAAAVELRAGDAPLAVQLADRSLALAPGQPMTAFTRAFGLSACGRLAEARAELAALDSGALAVRLRTDQPELAELVARELARIAAPVAPAATRTGVVPAPSASEFPLSARFDVLVKYLYALQRLGRLPGWVSCDVRALYVRHIQLGTGGVEPGDPAGKPTLASYLKQFDALIDSMAANGFDASHPIPLSSRNGMPCDGAHRCAAALAMGLEPVFVRSDAPGYRWDLPWFQRHGFGAEDCNVLLRAWAELSGDAAHVALLWAPVEATWPAIETELGTDMTLVGTRTIELPRAGFDELVRDVYSIDAGPQVGPAIENKIKLLGAHAARVRIVYAERRAAAPAPDAIKRRVRQCVDAVVPAAWFVTLHLSATRAETRHIMDIVTSETNLRVMQKRGPMDPALIRLLTTGQEALRARGIAVDNCCVVGGSVPAALGLRVSDDLDITLRSAQRHARFDAGITVLAPQLDLVTEGYARSFTAAAAPNDDALIENPKFHFRVRGMRFAHPAVVLERKQYQRREKDLRDLPLLSAFLDR